MVDDFAEEHGNLLVKFYKPEEMMPLVRDYCKKTIAKNAEDLFEVKLCMDKVSYFI